MKSPITARTLRLALVAVVALAAGTMNLAGAEEDGEPYEPDPQLIAAVRGYAQETDKGYDHVSRWTRALKSLGALDHMTAAEAQGHAETQLATRWDPVVSALEALEAARAEVEVDQQLIDAVRSYAQETANGADHVSRWLRTLNTLGALEDMSAIEAQANADRGWARWVPVAAALTELEAHAVAEWDEAARSNPDRANGINARTPNRGILEDGLTGQQDDPVTAPTTATANGNAVTLTFNQTVTAVLDATNQERGADQYGTALERLEYAFKVSGAYEDGVRLDGRFPSLALSGATLTLTMGQLTFPPGSTGISVSFDADFAGVLGAALRDGDGNNVPSFTHSDIASETTGTARPLLTGIQVAGTQLILTFDRALDPSSTPAGNRFRVVVHPDNWYNESQFVSGTGTATISGKTVTVTLASAVEQGTIAEAAYRRGDETNPLRDSVGTKSEVEAFWWTTATVIDKTPPTLDSSAATNTRVVLYYHEQLDTASTPSTSAFSVAKGGSDGTVTGVTVSPDAVTITYTVPDGASGTLTTTYTVPDSNPIRDLAGNAAETLAAFAPTVATTDSAPSLTNAETDGSEVTLTFSGQLDPASVPAASVFTMRDRVLGANAGFGPTITNVSVRGFKLVLELSVHFAPCDIMEIDYTKPAATEHPLKNLAGISTEVAGFSAQLITNQHWGGCAYEPLRELSMQPSENASGHANRLMSMTFDRALEPRSLPNKDAFAVTPQSGGDPIEIEVIRIPDDPTRLLLTLSRPLSDGEQVTASYRPPRSGRFLRDTDGNQLAPFSGRVEAPAALTAEFHNVPAFHDGASPFSFNLSFSDYLERKLSNVVLRDTALTATNGDVTHVRRVTKGHNQHWTVTVQPHSDAEVTVQLQAGEDCATDPAICTPDGRVLSNSPSLTVAPPLTATFMPGRTRHDGSAFVFWVRFSEDVSVTPRTLREDAFLVGGGTVRRAPRVLGRDDLRSIQIQPFGRGPVTVTLPATQDCAAAGAICTADGRPLARLQTLTVPGPR